MKARTRRAAETRWLYRMESTLLRENEYADKPRRIGFLRALARKVWAAEAPEGRRFPNIVAGQGVKHGGRFFSYCERFTRIVLARQQREVAVLLHELTHALGPCQHGAKFVKVYFRLLEKYGRYDPLLLHGVAAARGIAL